MLAKIALVFVTWAQTNQLDCQNGSATTTIRFSSGRARVTVVLFSDFESFPCARSASVLSGLLGQTRDVQLIFKHAPAATNPNSLLAHEAALAAGAQSKFWEMHDALFENQTKLTRADLVNYARALNLNLSAFQQALDDHTYRVWPENSNLNFLGPFRIEQGL